MAQLRGSVPAGEVSVFVVEALRHRLRIDPIVELLTRLDETHGPLTDEELHEGETWWIETKAQLSSMPEQLSGLPAAIAG